jgi:hypothetical protein
MVDAFNAAMDDYMLFSGEPVGRLLSTVVVDPDFAMGYCLTGCLRLFGGVGPTHPRVSLELRATRARRSRVTSREQAHIDAFEVAATGEFSKAGRMWDEILCEYPHDMMAAKCAHESYFLVGTAPGFSENPSKYPAELEQQHALLRVSARHGRFRPGGSGRLCGGREDGP